MAKRTASSVSAAWTHRIVPDTTSRVEAHTSATTNLRIQQAIVDKVSYYSEHPDEIHARLGELDREWDVERFLGANAGGLGLAGVLLGAFVDKRFLALPALVSTFLMQHAIQGWSPPVAVFRRLGMRTTTEIQTERVALKAVRGDFDDINSADHARYGWVSKMLRAARR